MFSKDNRYNKCYVPPGRMCYNCKKAKEDCSLLPFDRMPIISDYTDFDGGVLYIKVKCTHYVKEDHV